MSIRPAFAWGGAPTGRSLDQVLRAGLAVSNYPGETGRKRDRHDAEPSMAASTPPGPPEPPGYAVTVNVPEIQSMSIELRSDFGVDTHTSWAVTQETSWRQFPATIKLELPNAGASSLDRIVSDLIEEMLSPECMNVYNTLCVNLGATLEKDQSRIPEYRKKVIENCTSFEAAMCLMNALKTREGRQRFLRLESYNPDDKEKALHVYLTLIELFKVLSAGEWHAQGGHDDMAKYIEAAMESIDPLR